MASNEENEKTNRLKIMDLRAPCKSKHDFEKTIRDKFGTAAVIIYLNTRTIVMDKIKIYQIVLVDACTRADA